MSNVISIAIPKSVENLHLPDPELLTYFRNISNRSLWLDSEVDDLWLEYSRLIIEWNRDDRNIPVEQRQPIKLMFHTYGGDIDINSALIDLIKQSKTPIWGINMGQACSAGCFIFLACHRRLSMPSATFLIHNGEGAFKGTYIQIIEAVEEYERKINKLCAFLLENTKIPKDKLEEHIMSDWFISAKEAVDYGMVDEIVSSIDDVL